MATQMVQLESCWTSAASAGRIVGRSTELVPGSTASSLGGAFTRNFDGSRVNGSGIGSLVPARRVGLRAPGARRGGAVLVHASSGGKKPDTESKAVYDAFFLGKALAETIADRVGSAIGELLSDIGRQQAEQQKKIREFQDEVQERAAAAALKAAQRALAAERRSIVTATSISSPPPAPPTSPPPSTSGLSNPDEPTSISIE